MEEITNPQLEIDQASIRKRNRIKKTKRGILIVLNAVLACYLIYCISDTINEFYQKYFVNHDDTIISIRGYSTAKSLEIYNSVIDRDENGVYKTHDIVDFSFYAGYINFKSDSSLANEDGSLHYSSFDTYTLRRIDQKDKYEKIPPYLNVQSSINNSIFLFDSNLKEGDYIVYPYKYVKSGYESSSDEETRQEPLKLESQEGVFKTYYSPYINGKRRKIEIKSKSSSPALVISVTNIYTPEFTFNDLAILYKNDSDKNKLNEIFKDDKFSKKFIASNDSVKEDIISLYEAKANVTLILEEGEDIVVSHYIDLSSLHNEKYKNDTLSSEYALKMYDEDVYIRELGGSLFKSGGALPSLDGSTKWLFGYVNPYDMGSLVIKVGIDSIDELPTLLESIVNYNFL